MVSSIEQVYDLKGVGTNKTDSFIIMDTKPSTCEILIPEDIVRLEVEWAYPNWKVPFEERCGGALIRTPTRLFALMEFRKENTNVSS